MSKSPDHKHPVHPALVHFPIACWTIGTLTDIATLFTNNKTGWWFGGIMITIGVLAAIPTMLTGLIDVSRINTQSPATKTAHRHMLFALTTWSFYATSLFLRLDTTTGTPALTKPDFAGIALTSTGFLLLCITGWLGATLVYKFKTGILH